MPLSSLIMLGVSSVVTTVECATVVGDGVAVVGGAGQAVRVLGQTHACQGEGDGGAELLTISLCWRESLQVNHKDLWKTIQSVSLGAFPSCFTGLTSLGT